MKSILVLASLFSIVQPQELLVQPISLASCEAVCAAAISARGLESSAGRLRACQDIGCKFDSSVVLQGEIDCEDISTRTKSPTNAPTPFPGVPVGIFPTIGPPGLKKIPAAQPVPLNFRRRQNAELREGCEIGRDLRLAGFVSVANSVLNILRSTNNGEDTAIAQLATTLSGDPAIDLDKCASCCASLKSNFDTTSNTAEGKPENSFDASSCNEGCSAKVSCFDSPEHRQRLGCYHGFDFLLFGTTVVSSEARVECVGGGVIEIPISSPSLPPTAPNSSEPSDENRPEEGNRTTMLIGAMAGTVSLILLMVFTFTLKKRTPNSIQVDNTNMEEHVPRATYFSMWHMQRLSPQWLQFLNSFEKKTGDLVSIPLPPPSTPKQDNGYPAPNLNETSLSTLGENKVQVQAPSIVVSSMEVNNSSAPAPPPKVSFDSDALIIDFDEQGNPISPSANTNVSI